MLLSAWAQHPHDLGAPTPARFLVEPAPTAFDASQHLSMGIFPIEGEGMGPPWALCKG